MTIQDALTLHHAGRLLEAEQAYRQILTVQPNQYHVLHFLGILRAQQGDMVESAALITRALELNPADGLAHFHLAEALRKLRRYGQACDHYGQALARDAAFVPAYVGHAGCLLTLGSIEEALLCCEQGLQRDGNHPDLHACHGDALRACGRHDEAFLAYAKAISLSPGHLAGLIGRGRILFARGQVEEALAACVAAASAHPEAVEPLITEANLLCEMGQRDAALARYQQALAINSTSEDVYYAQGCLLLDSASDAAAIAAFDSALTIRPDFAEALYNRSFALRRLGRDDEALDGCERALALDPDCGLAAGLGFLLRALRCDWSGRGAALVNLERLCRTGKPTDPFTLLGAFDDPVLHLGVARRASASAAAVMTRPPSRRPKGRLRVAYLSPNFHPHPVAYQAVSVFEAHDHAQFETFGICLAPGSETPIRQRLRGAFDHFVEAGHCSDTALANLLQEHQIDIAVDLAGHTSGGRIAALRSAPIAVSWLGYPGTTGAAFVDYIIADSVLIPPADEAFYSEKVVRLPASYMPRDTAIALEPCPPRASLGLPQDDFIFSGFNNSFKVTPEVFAVWMRLLLAVDRSVLWLNIQNGVARDNLREEAAKCGVEPQRLIFADRAAGRAEHLARLAAADLFLDTVPYGAHSTASDMLWAGVPVLTCRGKSFAGRVSASMLKALALEELIATDLSAYEELAGCLAHDPSRLALLRQRLRVERENAALFDMPGFCASLEAAYQIMAERYRQGEKPQSFSANMAC